MTPLPRRFIACFLLLSVTSVAPLGHAADQTATQVYSDAVGAYNRGDVEGAQHKLQLALEIDKNYRPASAMLGRITADQRAGGTNAPGLSLRLLQTTVVPVEFKDTTLNSALELLRQRADETTGGKLKINFAVNLPPELANKRVTLKLDHVPVMEVLRYIGESTGVSFQAQRYAILVMPATVPPTPTP